MAAIKRIRHGSAPKSATRLTTYDQLAAYVHAFSKGSINLLILVGEGGLAKSQSFRASLPSEVCWISGNARPFGIYLKLYRHRNQLVVIDDVDSLHHDAAGIRLLKGLCQTDPIKVVAWQSSAKDLHRENIPREFETSSKVAIITNNWATLNRNVAALEDRGHVIYFVPSPLEVHRKVGEWFDDNEIYRWIGERIHLIPSVSMRTYFKAKELKSAGLDWQVMATEDQQAKKLKTVLELLADDTLHTQESRAEQFTVQGHGCRATYFNYLRRLR